MNTRSELLERYRALPLPDTSMEAWRFTDLAGFDPDAFAAPNGHVPGSDPRSRPKQTMLDIDAAAVATAAASMSSIVCFGRDRGSDPGTWPFGAAKASGSKPARSVKRQASMDVSGSGRAR